jgi:hypothetical protein
VQLTFRTMTRDFDEPNCNGDYLAAKFRNAIMPARGKLHDQRSRLIKINRVSRRALSGTTSCSALQLHNSTARAFSWGIIHYGSPAVQATLQYFCRLCTVHRCSAVIRPDGQCTVALSNHHA